MKFLKKAAALFFCLTLALSVMAITAAAEDTTTFSVKLDLVATSLHDYDDDQMPEVAGDATLTYNIQLASNVASQNVNGVTFTVDVSGVTGATYQVALAEGFSASVINGTSANSHSFVMDTGNYITTSATVGDFVTIGTLTVTLPGSIYDTQFTPALTSLSLAKNGVEAPFTPSYTAPTTVEVNPKYTITLTYKDTNDDGTIKAAASAPSGSLATLDYYYDNGTGTVSEGTFTPVNLPTPADITAYTNANQWTLGATVPSGTNGWTANETANAGSTIASGKIGNVTLEAVYTAIEYSYTVNYANNDETASLVGDTYTIENVATKLVTLNTIPTYTGYNFDQWTSTAGTKAGNWAASFDKDVALAGKYGDVSITATWTEMTFDINFKTYTPNANGVLEPTATESEQVKTSYGYVSGLAANSIALPTKYNGYICSGWKVTNIQGYTNTSGTGVAASGWTDGDTFDVTAAIPANRIGSITLEAVYTPISYTVTYVLDTDGRHNGKPEASVTTGTYTSSYTIEDVAGGADVFTLNTTPTRAGFSFVGWTAQGAANANEKDTTYKTDKLDITESFTTAPSFASAYGDVTFTAVWKAAGTGKAIEYAYAGRGNVLVLFAVENASSNVVGEYKYNGASMYQISDAAKYASEFANFDSEKGAIFAYITAAGADGYNYANNITLDKGEGRNFQITYDGNVYNDSAVNAGDFGNVLNMLNAGNNDEFNLGMVSRLKADNSADATGEVTNKYGSITDAKEIAAKVGSSVTQVESNPGVFNAPSNP